MKLVSATALAIVIAFLSLPPAAGAGEAGACRIRVAVSSFAEPNPNFAVLRPTIEALEEAFGKGSVCVENQVPLPKLGSEIREGSVQLFISSAGLLGRLRGEGAKNIASLMGGPIPDPNRAEASVVISRRDRPDITDLASLRGKVLSANMPLGFTGFLTVQREVAQLGADPDSFYSAIEFVGHDQMKVLDRVLSGKADAGAVRACNYEAMLALDPKYRGAFKVVGEREDAGFACTHSTRLYPSWVIGATKSLSPKDAAAAARAVFSMRPAWEGGYRWGIPPDMAEVDAVYRELRAGPYEFLRHWTLKRVWTEYGQAVVAILFLILGLAFHSLRSRHLVRVRTRELEEALARERELETEREKLNKRMGQMQRSGVVGQMSSMVAHELGQPLAAILMYIRGLRRRMETRKLERPMVEDALGKIESQANRIGSIVDHVRGYAKSNAARRLPLDLREILGTTVRNFSLTSAGRTVRVAEASEGGPFTVRGDPLELELVIANLLKNAAEALSDSVSPGTSRVVKASLLAEPGSGTVNVIVEDAGDPVTDELLRLLSTPVTSQKGEGLGLGLSICRTIVEQHGGSIRFEHGRDGLGVRVTVTLPALGPGEGAEQFSGEKA